MKRRDTDLQVHVALPMPPRRLLVMYACALPVMLVLQLMTVAAAMAILPAGDLAPLVPLIVWAFSRGQAGPNRLWLNVSAGVAAVLLLIEPFVIASVLLGLGDMDYGPVMDILLLAYLVGSLLLVVAFSVALALSSRGVLKARRASVEDLTLLPAVHSG